MFHYRLSTVANCIFSLEAGVLPQIKSLLFLIIKYKIVAYFYLPNISDTMEELHQMSFIKYEILNIFIIIQSWTIFSDHLFSLIQNRNYIPLLFQIFLSYLDENVDSLYPRFLVVLHFLTQKLPMFFKFWQNFSLARFKIRLIGSSKSIEKMTCRFVECSQ